MITNQSDYWNSTAQSATFTHPLNFDLLTKFLNQTSRIIDFGCGYGRITTELVVNGYLNITGIDSSIELINRAQINQSKVDYQHYNVIEDIRIEDNSVDCFLLFAVLTCIHDDESQIKLIDWMKSKLSDSGVIYISDYNLQPENITSGRYSSLDGDSYEFGVVKTSEGAIFRHHTDDWINILFQDFHLMEDKTLQVQTLKGNKAEAFQRIYRGK